MSYLQLNQGIQLSHLHSYLPERTGQVNIEAVRTLHLTTCHDLDLPETTTMEINYAIAGVRLLQELSPRSLDQLVSYGERCSSRIVAARLNRIGVLAQAFDAWDVGVMTIGMLHY
jgi:aspartate kinase